MSYYFHQERNPYNDLRENDALTRRIAYDKITRLSDTDRRTEFDERQTVKADEGWVVDCMEVSQMLVSSASFDLGIATIATSNFAQQVEDLFLSLERFGGIGDKLHSGAARLVLVAVNDDGSLAKLAARHNALVVECRSFDSTVNASIKAALYSLPHVLNAKRFICLDSDILVSGDLSPLLGALHAAPSHALLVCRGASDRADDEPRNYDYTASVNYGLSDGDSGFLMEEGEAARARYMRLNAGVFAGHRDAILAVDARLRDDLEHTLPFVSGVSHYIPADEFVWSIAVARLGCLSELDEIFNLQFFARDAAKVRASDGGRECWFGTERVRLLHFASPLGRLRYDEFLRFLGLRPAVYKCRVCAIRRACAVCIEPGSVALEPLQSGDLSAICRVCSLRAQGRTEADIAEELREIYTEIVREQNT